MEIGCIDIEFESNLVKLKEILESIKNILKNVIFNISEDDQLELRLIFSELLTNAVIHGNRENSLKKVRLLISVNEHYILATVSDEGEGFNYSQVLESDCYSADYLYENGIGLQLVNSLTDLIHFNKMGNEVKFTRLLHYEAKQECSA